MLGRGAISFILVVVERCGASACKGSGLGKMGWYGNTAEGVRWFTLAGIASGGRDLKSFFQKIPSSSMW